MRIEFTVYGTPQPQGSTKAFIPKGWNRAIITTDNKSLKPWRQDVSAMAKEAMMIESLSAVPVECAVSVECHFHFVRPRSLARRITQKTTKPDVDKLLRGALDAMAGIVFRDDAQVVESHIFKTFAASPGARIVVESR